MYARIFSALSVPQRLMNLNLGLLTNFHEVKFSRCTQSLLLLSELLLIDVWQEAPMYLACSYDEKSDWLKSRKFWVIQHE